MDGEGDSTSEVESVCMPDFFGHVTRNIPSERDAVTSDVYKSSIQLLTR